MENEDANTSQSNSEERRERGSKLSIAAQMTASAVAVGALILSITTWQEQSALTKTQNDFAKEQNRIAEKQNAISQRQEEIAARESTPAGVDWSKSGNWTDTEGKTWVTLRVLNREKESVDDVTLSIHETVSESSKIKKNYRFHLLDSCTKESINVPVEIIFDDDGSNFTLTFKDFTNQYWSRGLGAIKKAELLAPDPGLDDEIETPDRENNIC
ncbi:hypothetical protein ACFWCB_27960 [Streptomyces sp. NPDC060048]|uniref:hypothetical protein n=1 Tax=unclassified Streptomyces TaxID=2593676 RepID=UPI003694D204